MNDDGRDGHNNTSQTSFLDPYSRTRYDQGIDSKIVIMGNSGMFFSVLMVPHPDR